MWFQWSVSFHAEVCESWLWFPCSLSWQGRNFKKINKNTMKCWSHGSFRVYFWVGLVFVSILSVKRNNNFLLWAPIWAMGSRAGCFCLFGAWIPRDKKMKEPLFEICFPFIDLGMCVGMCLPQPTCGSQQETGGLVYSVYHLGRKDQTQVGSLGARCRCPLSLPSGPRVP